MPDTKPNPVLCAAIVSPSPDSAVLAITEPGGATHRFHLTLTQMSLFAAQAAEIVAKWPIDASTTG